MIHKNTQPFWSYVFITDETSCWLWCGSVMNRGYGYYGDKLLAHRVVYEELVEKIPFQVLHHTCRNPLCVNPRHLRPITQKEHINAHRLAGHIASQKVCCKRGHELTPENVYISFREGYVRRNCKKCVAYRRTYVTKTTNRP